MNLRVSIITKIAIGGIAIVTTLILLLLFSVSFKFNPILADLSIERVAWETRILAQKLERQLQIAQEDVHSLVRTPPVSGLVRAADNDGFDPVGNSTAEEWKSRMEVIFAAMLESRQIYNQLRVIDASGYELTRANYGNGFVEVVPTERLQDKSSRYYFQQSIDLQFGDIYASSIDLNREGDQQEIVEPYEPVLRYATPFFGGAELARGVVLVSVNMELVFHLLGEDYLETGDVYVIDAAGNFLMHPDPAKEWGGVRDLNTGENAQREFPKELLDTIRGLDSGAVNLGDFVWGFARVNYGTSGSEEQEVVIVTRIHKDLLFVEAQRFARQQLILGMFTLLLAGIVNWYIVERVLGSVRQIRDVMRQYVEGNFVAEPPVGLGNDELAEIADLSQSLAQNLIENRRSIEEKVQDRTRELEQQQELVEEQQHAILNIMEDVESEKERAELSAQDLLKFQLAAESASDQIVITDADGVIVYANPAIEQITGFRQEEVVGKKAGSTETWGGLMPAEFYKKMWHRLKEEKKVFTGHIKNQHKDGHTYYALATISPVKDEQGEVKFFVAIERDITKEKEIDEAKTEFVSLASHQLRTPLSAINWYAEMLLDGDAGPINDEQRSFLQEIYTGNQRMVDLVNALLNVSRLELGTFTVEPEPTNLIELIDSVIDELRGQLEEKNMKLLRELESDIPMVKLDPKLFRIVVQNLLSNATKYTPPEGTITVRLKRVAAGNQIDGHVAERDSFLFQVADNGIGIPSQQQDQVFSKLFRADNVHKVDSEGTGLGLYAIKKVVEVAGGEIWFVSKEDIGTTFSVMMPMSGMQSRKGRTELIEMK